LAVFAKHLCSEERFNAGACQTRFERSPDALKY